MELAPRSFHICATSALPSPLKSPARNTEASNQRPAFSSQWTCMNLAPSDFRRVNVVRPSLFHAPPTSVSPSPSKSPANHLIESPHPPSRSLHWVHPGNDLPSERKTAT